ncbi:hypothetical protein B0H16DRAFT_1698494 [Mycena metata]|uniref:Uncharacterized protein n=1 Tax=Mycena metata TaxID=1033252 RepID=A0AAD7MNG1_9AGAR|nr:hypothetical protein B0H16DRAFT_1698494 [Mycena metata]
MIARITSLILLALVSTVFAAPLQALRAVDKPDADAVVGSRAPQGVAEIVGNGGVAFPRAPQGVAERVPQEVAERVPQGVAERVPQGVAETAGNGGLAWFPRHAN